MEPGSSYGPSCHRNKLHPHLGPNSHRINRQNAWSALVKMEAYVYHDCKLAILKQERIRGFDTEEQPGSLAPGWEVGPVCLAGYLISFDATPECCSIQGVSFKVSLTSRHRATLCQEG